MAQKQKQIQNIIHYFMFLMLFLLKTHFTNDQNCLFQIYMHIIPVSNKSKEWISFWPIILMSFLKKKFTNDVPFYWPVPVRAITLLIQPCRTSSGIFCSRLFEDRKRNNEIYIDHMWHWLSARNRGSTLRY